MSSYFYLSMFIYCMPSKYSTTEVQSQPALLFSYEWLLLGSIIWGLLISCLGMSAKWFWERKRALPPKSGLSLLVTRKPTSFVLIWDHYMFLIICMWVGVHPSAEARGIGSLRAGVTCSCKLPGVDAGSSGRVVHAPNLWALSPTRDSLTHCGQSYCLSGL